MTDALNAILLAVFCVSIIDAAERRFQLDGAAIFILAIVLSMAMLRIWRKAR